MCDGCLRCSCDRLHCYVPVGLRPGASLVVSQSIWMRFHLASCAPSSAAMCQQQRILHRQCQQRPCACRQPCPFDALALTLSWQHSASPPSTPSSCHSGAGSRPPTQQRAATAHIRPPLPRSALVLLLLVLALAASAAQRRPPGNGQGPWAPSARMDAQARRPCTRSLSSLGPPLRVISALTPNPLPTAAPTQALSLLASSQLTCCPPLVPSASPPRSQPSAPAVHHRTVERGLAQPRVHGVVGGA
jgi:hypothetical protein